MFYGATAEIFRLAENQRKRMTPSERKLWDYLKIKSNTGYKFRRQHPISHFVVDFYCHPLQLVIEVDGGIHSREDIVEKDANREEELKSFGLQIMRFRNEEVDLFFEDVMQSIAERIEGIRRGV
jgi:very-short-patch-repair endonuclease